MGSGLSCFLSCSTTDAVITCGDKHNNNKEEARKSRGSSLVDGDRDAENEHQSTNNDSFNFDNDIDGNYEEEACCYEDEEGCDLFFEAHQSLSQIVSELPYPPTSMPHSGCSKNVSVDLPESLLNPLSPQRLSGSNIPNHTSPRLSTDNNMKVIDDTTKDGFDVSTIKEEGSEASSTLLTRSTIMLTERLTERGMMGAGYPGELSEEELEACLEFRRRLKESPDPTYRAMVHLNFDVDLNSDGNHKTSPVSPVGIGGGPEEEAFALCRFLRARQFDVDKTFAMMDDHLEIFREALKMNDLHRSKTKVENHIGCPLPVFTKQFPMVDYGLATNGAFVGYLRAGQIRLQDGFDVINKTSTPKEFIDRYIPMVWYMTCRVFCETMHRLQAERQAATNDSDDFAVLAEAVIVVDLEGLQRELFNKRTMEFLPVIFQVIQCFPEILNRVLIINVPYFFPFVWSVLKHFIDARTARKIGFYSSLASAQKDLVELVDPAQTLLEYGGTAGNPTYDEALAQKLARDDDYDRYVFERFSSKTSTKKGSGKNSAVHTLQTFSLNETEEAELTVYTQAKLEVGADGKSKSGTKFLLLPDNDDSSSPVSAGPSGNTNAHRSRRHPRRYGQPAVTSEEHSMVSGPGIFRLVVETSEPKITIDKALLVVSIR